MPASPALFVLARKLTAGLSQFKGVGKVLQISLRKDKEEALREAIRGTA